MNERSRDKLQLALRVLLDVVEGNLCSAEDECALRRVAGSLDGIEIPLDELARLVVRREGERLLNNHVLPAA